MKSALSLAVTELYRFCSGPVSAWRDSFRRSFHRWNIRCRTSRRAGHGSTAKNNTLRRRNGIRSSSRRNGCCCSPFFHTSKQAPPIYLFRQRPAGGEAGRSLCSCFPQAEPFFGTVRSPPDGIYCAQNLPAHAWYILPAGIPPSAKHFARKAKIPVDKTTASEYNIPR